ncbi:MAG: TIGR00266 family protein [Acidobacteriota bacterium]
MHTVIEGGPTFAHIHVDLAPGERLTAEADAMASMAADIGMQARLNGGFFGALARRFLGGESLFVNDFENATQATRRLTLTQATPGEIRPVALKQDDGGICLQPGAYIASTPGVEIRLRYAGLASFIGREGLFKLHAVGEGTLWYGAYGSLLEQPVDGEYIVDTGHLVAYDPGLQLKVQLAGGVFASFFGGEGLVTRVEGRGTIILQTRSLSGLAGWLNPRL